jgi:ubiquinol-cytochrome c reductase cytochrome c subunit
MTRAWRWWWRRPARLPRGLRAALAASLGALALFGLLSASSGASSDASAGNSPAPPTKYPDDPRPGDAVTRYPSSPQLVSVGRSLYDNGCSACHGLALQGKAGMGPALQHVGAGPVDFYLSSGRMPLQQPTDEPERARPGYDRRQRQALIAFITSHGRGPRVAPAADPAHGSLSLGLQVFTSHCAGCHQMVGRGGLVVGAWVPDLQHADARQIAEAVRMGPYLMPHFDSDQIDQHQLDSLARYVLWTRHPSDSGGWGLDNIGPIPEGLAAWFIAVLALLIVARLIGERTQGANL